MTKKKNNNAKNLFDGMAESINLNKQMAYLRENKRKIHEDDEIYFNETQDQIDLKKYYKSVAAAELNKLPLFYKYNELLDKTHKNRIPYYISKDLYLYTWVDLYPDGTVKSIYTGEKKDPESLILYDYKVISQKYEDFERFLEKVHRKEFELFKQLKTFERSLKLNTEHIVPKSWFGGLEPMKGDLHHLFICDPECNIARSNFPYQDLSDYHPQVHDEELIYNQCGTAADDCFEPVYGKGIAARAMLYFVVRYPNVIKKTFRTQINIPLLIRWHRQFPVTLYEKHRNQAIYRIQGNRNPFIDFPDLWKRLNFPI